MEDLKNIMITLADEGVYTHISYDFDIRECYLDLQTEAKSHLYLYESGILKGRYKYETTVDFHSDNIVEFLCREFSKALCHKDYGNGRWFALCEKLDIKNI